MVLGPVILLEDPSRVLLDLIFQEKALKKLQSFSYLLMNSLKLRAFQQVSLALV